MRQYEIRQFWRWIERETQARGLTFAHIEAALDWRSGRLWQAQSKGWAPAYETLTGMVHLLRLDWDETLGRLPTDVARRMRGYQHDIDICLTCPLPECVSESKQCPLMRRKENEDDSTERSDDPTRL